MIKDEWIYQIIQHMPFEPTKGQSEAVERISAFLADKREDVVMILRGSAGTGKTSVARALVRAMTHMRQKVVLMAPTGRAAKVLAMGSGHAAFTIHRTIYRQQAYMAEKFALNNNLHTDTLFVVDEASMVSHGPLAQGGEAFGSGDLLDDVIRYVYSGRNCRLMIIGDTAQLPPIGCDEAPALMSAFIAGYGKQVYDYDLLEVLRQSAESGVLFNATKLRSMITHDDITELPKIQFNGFADIRVCPGNELIEELGSSYHRVGHDETIVITRSNKRANVYNMGIRNQVLWYEEELTSGDRLMIVKNNYFWTAEGDEKNAQPPNHSTAKPLNLPTAQPQNHPAFLANGDCCVVRRVFNHREFYGFRFADVICRFPDYDDYELTATVILDTLHTEAPALTTEQQTKLFNEVMLDYADVPQKHERVQKLRQDAYFNALQVKYAYAVTCHKAQGGQWAHVYLDQGYMTDDMLTPAYIHWLYTAFTRATERLYLVNWPKTQQMENG